MLFLSMDAQLKIKYQLFNVRKLILPLETRLLAGLKNIRSYLEKSNIIFYSFIQKQSGIYNSLCDSILSTDMQKSIKRGNGP